MTPSHDLALLDMPALLAALYRDVDAARRRVLIEVYIYASDALGRDFAEHLVAARARGVDVRVLYDPLGSEKTEEAFFRATCARGVPCRAYCPMWETLGQGRLAPRNHSRIFLVDDAAYTGGAAFSHQWAPRDWPEGGGWHDVGVRVQGPVVADFEALFEQRWREADPKGAAPKDYDTGDRYPDVRLVGDTPRKDRSLVYEAHVARIREARARVWLANAYFLPPPPMRDALFAAAARGVDVRLLLPGESDLPIVRRAARAEYGMWIDAGLAVYEYQGVVMHSKYAVVDDDWCTVGTFNANSSSLGGANELNLFVTRPDFVARCAAQFETDLAHAERVARDAVAGRPLLQQAVDQLANDAFAVVDLVVGPPKS